MGETFGTAHTRRWWTSSVRRTMIQFLVHMSSGIPRRVAPYRACSTYRTYTTKVVRLTDAYQCWDLARCHIGVIDFFDDSRSHQGEQGDRSGLIDEWYAQQCDKRKLRVGDNRSRGAYISVTYRKNILKRGKQ